MKKSFLPLAIPFFCLASCGSDGSLLSDGYKPNPDLAYIIRNGESYVNGESGYANLCIDQNPEKAIDCASSTGETLLVYFYSEGCHFCEEVKAGFAEFLEKTNIKVLAYSYTSSPNYHAAVSAFKAVAKENAEIFFKDWGTPYLFTYKDGEFSKVPLYGNHGSAKAVASMMDGLYSFPYLYELTTSEGISSFLEKGYPVYLLNEGEALPEIMKSSIQASTKRIGYVPKAKLSEEDLKNLNNSHGDPSCLLTSDGEIKKENCSSYLASYFEN